MDTLAAERETLQQRCRDLEADTARTTTEHLAALERLVRPPTSLSKITCAAVKDA